MDRDVITTQKNLSLYENKFGHQLSTIGPKESDIPKDYFIPNFGLDRDIIWTQKNLKDTEKVLDSTFVEIPEENVYLYVSREPLMTNVEAIPYTEHELDYSKIE